MFEKILAILPYNPSLVHQMSFYARRMREEAAIRRIGLIFMVLTFMIQFFAVLSPPQPTVAANDNSLISGGISSAADAKRNCVNNVRHYGDIVAYYGITCAEIGQAQTVTINSTDQGSQLFSMGHNPQGPRNINSGIITHEVPVNVPDAGTLYFRSLHSFDTRGSSSYQALKLKSSVTGRTFWILFNCGNLVAVGVPVPVQPCKYNRNLAANSPKCVPPCQYNRTLAADSPKCFQPCQYNKELKAGSPECFQPCKYDKTIPANSSKCVAPCKYDKTIAANSPKCYAPCPVPGKTGLPQSSPQCTEPCPYNNAIAASSPQCFPPCQYNPALSANSPDCVAPVAPCQYNNALLSDSPDCTPPCQFNSTIAASSPQCFPPCQYNHSISADSTDCFPPCQYNSGIASSDANCKPCDKGTSAQDTIACIAVHKTAANITTGIANADGTTANAGDVITYTLYAENSAKDTVKGFTFEENLSDVLDYADATDLHGGTIDKDNVVSWPAVNIAAGTSATVQVTIKVKDPIPQTPPDPNDPSHFDLVMTNVYGNTINIKLPGNPVTAIEATATTLPNTGPGTGLFFAAVIVIIGGYFYGRARLLEKESILAVQETVGA